MAQVSDTERNLASDGEHNNLLLTQSSIVRKIELKEFGGAVGELTLTMQDGNIEVQQLASTRFLQVAHPDHRTTVIALKHDEYWIGIEGYIDQQDGDTVLVLHFLIFISFSRDGKAIERKVEPNTKAHLTALARPINWQLPPGFAVRAFRLRLREDGVIKLQGFNWVELPNVEHSARDAIGLKVMDYLGASQELMTSSKSWVAELLVLTAGIFYIDVILDVNSTIFFLSEGQHYNFGLMVTSLLCSASFSYMSFSGFYRTLAADEGVELFGRLYQPMGSTLGISLQVCFFIAHLLQLHMAGFVLLSLRFGDLHPLLRHAKEVEAVFEASLAAIVQCYGAVYYEWIGWRRTMLFLSLGSSLASLGFALANYDRDTMGFFVEGQQDLPGTLQLGFRFGVVCLLRVCEVCSRITSLALLQRLTRPFGGFMFFALDLLMLFALHWFYRPKVLRIKEFVVSVVTSTIAWRNPLLERANAASIPFRVYYFWRFIQLLLMVYVARRRFTTLDITFKLINDGDICFAFFASTSAFYLLLLCVRHNMATFGWEREHRVEVKHSNTKTLKLKLGTVAAGPMACQTLVEYLNNKETADFNIISCNGGQLGLYLVPELLREFPMCAQLVLYKCAVSPATIATVLKALTEANVTWLELNCNPEFGDLGARELARFLQTDSKLVRLELDSCGITDDGAGSLFEALSKNGTLATLSLQGTLGLTDRSGTKLEAALSTNRTLKSLELPWSKQKMSEALVGSLTKLLRAGPAARAALLRGDAAGVGVR